MLLTLVLTSLLLPPSPTAAEEVPPDSQRWALDGQVARVETHLGRPALYLNNARAVLADANFTEGVIEFDLAFGTARGFSGVRFHHRGPGEYEEFYLRPHQTGQVDACQYQPVFAGYTAWQILHGPGYGAALDHTFDAWQHVRIVVSGGQAEVYVDSDEPVLFVDDLMRRSPGGGLALMSSFAPAHFSNFRFERAAGLPLRGTPVERAPLAPGTVTSWQVSSAFSEARLGDATDLFALEPELLDWTELEVEVHGVANLARTLSAGAGDTVLARVTLVADDHATALFDFGFSDRVRVFANGRLVFLADDGYRTRDYRYLGTVGLFDTLVLPLEPGPNDLTFAVSESFGGFAIAGRLRPTPGVSVAAPTSASGAEPR